MDDKHKRDLTAARKRAEDSVARIPAAEAAEAELAQAEGREPTIVQPLTEVPADAVLAAVEAIKGEVKPELSDVIEVYRKSLRRSAGQKVAVRSDQLLAVLDAAGIGTPAREPNADV